MAEQRRFKKRYIALIILLALGAFIGRTIWLALSAEPGQLIDYHEKARELSASIQAPGADRWPDFRETLAFAAGLQSAAEAQAAAPGQANPWSDVPIDAVYSSGHGAREEFPAMQARGREWVDSFRAAGLFERTAALPDLAPAIRPGGDGPLLAVLLPQLAEARVLARMQTARMRMSADAGDWDDFVAAFEESLAAGRIIASQTTIIEYLTGIALENLAMHELRRVMVRTPIEDPAVIDALLAAMERQRLPSMAHALEGERYILLDMIQRVYTDDGHGDGRLILSRVGEELGGMIGVPAGGRAGLPILNVASPFFPSRAETVADLDRGFDALIRDVQTPKHAREQEFDFGAYVASLPSRQFILEPLMPAMASARETSDVLVTVVAGTRLLLRIERHRLGAGAAPATLAELAEADPDADIIDPMTGEPFLYTLLEDDPAGRPYLLYAAGFDGADNAGAEAEPSTEALTPGHAGTDFVINHPPEPPQWDDE